jgi:thiosulfate/3-mercaptopyruvate sulfurtransferase
MVRAYLFSRNQLPKWSYPVFSKSINYQSCFSAPSKHRSFSTFLVSPKDLHEAMRMSPSSVSMGPRIIPLCTTWFPDDDSEGRTGIQAFHEKRIPKARFFDLNKVIDAHSPYPHMLPGAEDFAASMGELGVRKEDILVVYDTRDLGVLSAPRVGWMLKAFGHPRVYILNNFKLWIEEKLPIENGAVQDFEPSIYPVPMPGEAKLATMEDVRAATTDYHKGQRAKH